MRFFSDDIIRFPKGSYNKKERLVIRQLLDNRQTDRLKLRDEEIKFNNSYATNPKNQYTKSKKLSNEL